MHRVAMMRRVDGEHQSRTVTQKRGSRTLKKIPAAAVALAGLAGLTACSVSAPAPGATTSSATLTTSSPAPSQAAPSGASDASASQAGGVKAACEQFNSLFAEYKAITDDANAYEDIYLAAQEAKAAASGNQVGLLTSLSILALDRSSAVESGGEVEQASKDGIRDAVFANANECTAEGVTLTL
jgi:ABC-type glycerol-3-phosphate transport system substrate-binding protein